MAKAPTPPIAYTISDACGASGFPRTRLYSLIAAGDVVAFKVGRRTMIRADSLRKYIASLPRATMGAGRQRAA